MKSKILSILKSKLFSSFGIYILSSLINAAIPFLMLPLFTNYLTPKDYGIVSMFAVLCSFFMPFVGLSTVGVVGREFFNNSNNNFPQYIGNIFIILLLSIVPIIFLVFIFSDFISDLSNSPVNNVWLALLFSIFSFFSNISFAIWQVQKKSRMYAIFQIGQTLFNIILTVFFVVFLKFGWEGRILAQLIAMCLFGLVSFYILFKNKLVEIKFNKYHFLDALKVGVPLIPHSIGAILMAMTDRVLISNMVGIEDAGLFAVGYTIGNIIGFIEHSFNLAFAPWLFEKLNLNDASVKFQIVKYTYLYFFIILFTVLILTFLLPYIYSLFINDKFAKSQIFVFWIALSFAFSGMYKMVTNYIFYVKKTHILAWITFGSAIVNFGLNYFLIIQYGAVGAAISTAIVSFLFFIFTWILSNRVYKMPWALNKSFLIQNNF